MHRLVGLLSVLILALAACASADTGTETAAEGAVTTAEPSEDPEEGLNIVATTSILGDLVADLVGEDAEVEVLLPRGADPHDFSVSTAQAESMREADLVVVNGLGLEEGMRDAIESAEDDGANLFEAASVIEPIEFGGEHGHEDEEHAEAEHSEDGEHAEAEHSEDEEHAEDEAHDHEGGNDPHFWMDPSRLGASVDALGAEIAEIDDSLDDEEWADRADELISTLTELDAEVSDILSVVPEGQRVLVTNHEAFGYFADAYDFEIVGTVIPGGATLAEPSAAGLEELVETIEAEGVTAVFAENTDPSRLAEVVAEEAGAEVVVGLLHSDSLSSEDGLAASYREYMLYNATTIADALSS